MPCFLRRSHAVLVTLSLSVLPYFSPESALADVVATGSFQSKEAGLVAAGGFEIQENGGKHTLVVKSDFKVSDGPDLYFAFHPQAAAQVSGGNAKSGTLRVDPMLRSLSGAQTYDIPAGFDLSKYQSIIIHCWKFNHLYAAGAIRKSETPSALGPAAPGVGAGGKTGRENILKREGGRMLLEGKETEVDAAGKVP